MRRIRILGIRAQQALEQAGIEDINAHRRERDFRAPRHGFWIARLFLEADHPVGRVDRHDAELARAIERHFDDADGDVGFLLDVKADHRTVVHLVDVIARQHEHVQRPVRTDQLHVLPQRVGCALVPLGAATLLRRDDLDELAEFAAQEAPALADVLDQRVCLVLRQHRDLPDAGVEAIREHEIDDAELAAEGRRGLAAIFRQLPQSFAATARHDHGERASRQPAQVSTRCENSLRFRRHPNGLPRHLQRLMLQSRLGRKYLATGTTNLFS